MKQTLSMMLAHSCKSKVRIFRKDGRIIKEFQAYPDNLRFGVNVSPGRIALTLSKSKSNLSFLPLRSCPPLKYPVTEAGSFDKYAVSPSPFPSLTKSNTTVNLNVNIWSDPYLVSLILISLIRLCHETFSFPRELIAAIYP